MAARESSKRGVGAQRAYPDALTRRTGLPQCRTPNSGSCATTPAASRLSDPPSAASLLHQRRTPPRPRGKAARRRLTAVSSLPTCSVSMCQAVTVITPPNLLGLCASAAMSRSGIVFGTCCSFAIARSITIIHPIPTLLAVCRHPALAGRRLNDAAYGLASRRCRLCCNCRAT